MGKYLAGPSVLRFTGRSAVVPGQAFEHAYDEAAHEAMALASGAIALQPGETSMSDQIAAQRAADEARLVSVAKTSPSLVATEASTFAVAPAADTDASNSGDDSNRSGPAPRRRTSTIDKKEQ